MFHILTHIVLLTLQPPFDAFGRTARVSWLHSFHGNKYRFKQIFSADTYPSGIKLYRIDCHYFQKKEDFGAEDPLAGGYASTIGLR